MCLSSIFAALANEYQELKENIKRDPNYINNNKQEYKKFFIKAAAVNYGGGQFLKEIDKHYIQNNPIDYRDIAVIAAAKSYHSIAAIDTNFIKSYPHDYKAIIIAAEPDRLGRGISLVERGYIEAHPEDYADIALHYVQRGSHALEYIDKSYIKTYPAAYKQLAILGCRNRAEDLRLVDTDYIKTHVQDYCDIINIAVEKYGSFVFTYINDDFVREYPQDYQKLVGAWLSIKCTVGYLQSVKDSFIQDHPEDYKALALLAVQNLEYIISGVNGSYILAHPQDYKDIALAAVIKHPQALLHIDKDYKKAYPAFYKEIVLAAIQQSENRYLPTEMLELEADAFFKAHPRLFKEVLIANGIKNHPVKQHFWAVVQRVDRKCENLKSRGYFKEAAKAEEVFDAIAEVFLALIKKQLTADKFQSSCHLAISRARPFLEEHRGWKEFFADFATAIVSLVTLGIVNLAYHRLRLFTCKTDSAMALDNVQASLVALDGIASF